MFFGCVCVCVCVCVVNYTAEQASKAQSSPLPNYYIYRYHHRMWIPQAAFAIDNTPRSEMLLFFGWFWGAGRVWGVGMGWDGRFFFFFFFGLGRGGGGGGGGVGGGGGGGGGGGTIPVVSGFSGLLQASEALLKEQMLEAGQVRVGGREGLTLAPGV